MTDEETSNAKIYGTIVAFVMITICVCFYEQIKYDERMQQNNEKLSDYLQLTPADYAVRLDLSDEI